MVLPLKLLLLADHCIFDKWAPLVDGANTECKASILSSNPNSVFQLNFTVFAKGLLTLAFCRGVGILS